MHHLNLRVFEYYDRFFFFFFCFIQSIFRKKRRKKRQGRRQNGNFVVTTMCVRASLQVTKTEPCQVSARKRVIYPHRCSHGSPTIAPPESQHGPSKWPSLSLQIFLERRRKQVAIFRFDLSRGRLAWWRDLNSRWRTHENRARKRSTGPRSTGRSRLSGPESL